MFEVIAASMAFVVETVGLAEPCGHNVMKPRGLDGTTVALNTYDLAVRGGAQALP